LFYYKDAIIYKDYFINDLSYMTLNKTQDTLIPKASKSIIQNYYYGANLDSTYGYYYNTVKAIKDRKVSMDSMKKKNSLLFSFDKLYQLGTNLENNILVKSEKLKNNELLEKYVPKIKVDATYDDTSYFFYSSDPDMKGLNFSLSKTADSIKSKKLYKFRSLYLANSAAVNESDKIEKEVIIELKKITVEDENTIIELFEKITKLYAGI